MRSSPILSRYIGRQYLMGFLLLLGVFLSLIMILDALELLRRAGNRPAVTLEIVMTMTLYKLPDVGQKVFPFIVLFSAMFTFWRLTRSAELVVARAVGVSVWQFINPVVVVALIIGILKIAMINPVGAKMLEEYHRMDEKYFVLKTSSMKISNSGIWVRQVTADGEYYLHADATQGDMTEFVGITVLRFDGSWRLLNRIEAPKARLTEGEWEISDASLFKREAEGVKIGSLSLPTELSIGMIEDSFMSPDEVSFWELPKFIDTLEATGFPSAGHVMYYNGLLAQPAMLCAMVLFAAAFSLRPPRRGGVLWALSGGVAVGFFAFIGTDVVNALGTSGTIPILLAAWSPPAIAGMAGIAALLHLEDG